MRQITSSQNPSARTVVIHPPTTIKNSVAKQGPFLFQPSPLPLEQSEGSDAATDIVYMTFENSSLEDEAEAAQLGVILIVFQDGRVDVCLDVDKIEARWEKKVTFVSVIILIAPNSRNSLSELKYWATYACCVRNHRLGLDTYDDHCRCRHT